MEFIYPGFLWALLAVAIPVIIHLFYFRRFKKVYFSNIKFLKEIKEETTNTNKLKNLLILLARILTIVFLVLAFAQPFIPQGEKVNQGSTSVSIYIDNSFSMQALSEDVSLIEKAKKIARDIIEGYSDNTSFQIVTNELHGEDQRWIDKKDALEKIGKINLNSKLQTINNIMNRQNQAFMLSGALNKHAFWISDFQKSVFDVKTEAVDSTVDYNLVILQAVRENNISIDSCFWEKPLALPGYVNKLIIKMSNFSESDVDNIPLSLEYNKEVLPLGKFSIRASSSITDTVEIRIKSSGWNEARISLKDYPIIFDDEYFLTFKVPDKIKILNLNEGKGANRYLNNAFDYDQYFDFLYLDINKVDYSNLDKNQLVILEDIEKISTGLSSSLINAMNNGLNVLLFPGKGANIQSLNSFLGAANANILEDYSELSFEADLLNRQEFVLEDIFDKAGANIPPIKVKGKFKLSNLQARNKYDIIKYRNGESFISRYTVGNGQLFLCSAPFTTEINDLSRNPDIFVPMLFKMSISNAGVSKLSHTIGTDKIISMPRVNIKKDSHLKIRGNGSEFIPKQLVTTTNLLLDEGGNISKSGIYAVFQNDSLLAKAAYNYNRKESQLDYTDIGKISDKLNKNVKIFDNKNKNFNFTKLINAKQRGIELWKWAVILALIFLAIEIILLRFWKN
ncbi:MAG: BatA domain-containing protein [Deltaproteobacteria bacterium]